MTSKVGICNLALSRLGANTITSFTDGTQEAILCSTFFDDLAKRVMLQGSWTSTVKRASLAKTTNTPTYGYSCEYQLPVDPKCLKVLEVMDCPEYQVESDKLLTDSSSVKIKYIAYLDNAEDWDSLLSEAFEILLASYLAMPLTGDKGLSANLKQEYTDVVSRNLAIDGQQGTKQLIVSDDLTSIR